MAKNIMQRVKKTVYGLAEKVGGDVKNRTGTIGTIADVTQKAGGAVKDGVEGVVEAGKGMHDEIKKSGGYGAAFKRTGKAIAGTAVSAYETVYGSIKSTYQSLENRVCTNGKFDSEKVGNMLSDQAEAVKQYGIKAYNQMSKLVVQGTDALNKDFHQYIPTKEEFETKYQGIGSQYKGVLFRENCEDCLTFYNSAEKIIPKGAKYRRQILNDIKASASGTKKELVDFYSHQIVDVPDKSPVASYKLEALNKYL